MIKHEHIALKCKRMTVPQHYHQKTYTRRPDKIWASIRSQLQSSIIFTYDMRIIVFSVKVNAKLYCHGISVSYIEVLVHNNVAFSHSNIQSPRVSSYYINAARESDEIKLKTRTFHTLSVPLYDFILLSLSSSLSVSSSS